jgi:hypothetical protein
MHELRLLQLALLATVVSVSNTFAVDYVIAASNAKESNNVYYRVGLVQDDGIDWGNEARMTKMKAPVIATDDEIAVLVYAQDKEMFYRVGQVDTEMLAVEWGPVLQIGKGRSPAVSMVGSQLILVYRGSQKDKLFYAFGEANGPRKQVVWESAWTYDDKGRNPQVAAGSVSATVEAVAADAETTDSEAPPVDAQLATLVLSTMPGNAEVTVDARFLGHSPVSLSVDPTVAHTIQITLDGHHDLVRIFEANTLVPGSSEPMLLRMREK